MCAQTPLTRPTDWFSLACVWLRANRTLVQFGFVFYAIILVTLTHWPSLAVAKPFGIRLDLFIHMGVFGGWNLLLISTGWFGLVGSRTNIIRATTAALIYATIDELTQGIPIVHRTVDPMDLLANSTGIIIIGTIYFVLARRYPLASQG